MLLDVCMGQQNAEADSLHQQQPGDFTIEYGDAAAWQSQNPELILQKVHGFHR